jgi:hypothetical protein
MLWSSTSKKPLATSSLGLWHSVPYQHVFGSPNKRHDHAMLALDHTCSTNVPLVLHFFCHVLSLCCPADYAACMLWNLKLRRWEVGGFPVSWILGYPRFVKQHCIGGWLFSRSVLQCPNSGDGDLSVQYSADGCTKTNSMESSSFPSFSIEVSNLSQLLPKWLVLSAFF